MNNFILEGHEPVAVDLMTWARWFSTCKDRHVADTMVGDVRISTVFLGIDHSFTPDGPPILFESMVFGGKLDQEQERYYSWQSAEEGHKAMVQRVKDTEQDR